MVSARVARAGFPAQGPRVRRNPRNLAPGAHLRQDAAIVSGELAVSPMRIVESDQANGIEPPVDADK